VGYEAQPTFWNAVAEVRWKGTATGLLAAVKEVERRVGRTPTFRNGPREIDVDILDLGGRRRTQKDPMLPHPRLATRRFALQPLAEIAPRWHDPVSGRTARELLARLPARPSVRKIGPLV
jgi:2-amino-4-hydroxy-6-hydroxymethyldihydropteridine diphosphokinase